MIRSLFIVLVSSLIVTRSAQAFIDVSFNNYNGFVGYPNYFSHKWDGFVVTWNQNVSDPNAFRDLPQREVDAIADGWVKLDTDCTRETSLGFRYALKNNLGIMPIYDINGFPAGFQSAILREDAEQHVDAVDYTRAAEFNSETINGTEVLVWTAYFIYPGRICGPGRSQEQFDQEGTGNALFLQNGSDPVRDSVFQSWYEGKYETDMGWTFGACIPTMGQHYYMDFRVDKNCSQLSPSFVMYNPQQKNIIGFGVNLFLNASNPYFENVKEDELHVFTNSNPSCFDDTFKKVGAITALHVWVTSKAKQQTCD